MSWNPPRGQERLDFGNFTAQDAADWLNTTNPESTYADAGEFAANFLEAIAIDEHTLEIGLASPTYFCLPLSQFGCLSAAGGPYLARAVDVMDLEWAQAYAVGTGPFVQGHCIAGDVCTAHAGLPCLTGRSPTRGSSATSTMDFFTTRRVWNPGYEYDETRDFADALTPLVTAAEQDAVIEDWLQWVSDTTPDIPIASYRIPWAVGPDVDSWPLSVHTSFWPSELHKIQLR